MKTTEERLRKIIADHLAAEPSAITRDSDILDDLGADSLDTVELLIATEEAFGLTIEDADWEAVATFGDAVDLVERLLG